MKMNLGSFYLIRSAEHGSLGGQGDLMQKRAEETRNKLMEAGERLFSRDGYHATSSKKIAKEAGVAVGSFYNHFKDKKELLFAIHQRHAQGIHELMMEKLQRIMASEAGDGRELSLQLVKQMLKMHSFSPDLHREISALAYTDPDFAAMSRREEKEAVDLMLRLIEPRREALRVDDLEAAAWVVAQSVEAVIHGIKIFGAPYSQKRLVEALADMLHRFLFK